MACGDISCAGKTTATNALADGTWLGNRCFEVLCLICTLGLAPGHLRSRAICITEAGDALVGDLAMHELQMDDPQCVLGDPHGYAPEVRQGFFVVFCASLILSGPAQIPPLLAFFCVFCRADYGQWLLL